MGKTETIKARRIDVYVPTIQLKNKWQEMAKERGTSLSKMMLRSFMNTIEENTVEAAELRHQNMIRLAELEEQNKELTQDNLRHQKHIEFLESELRDYRMQGFKEVTTHGLRQYDKDLVNLLKSTAYPLRDGAILGKLGVKTDELEIIRSVGKQLENLQDYGLVRYTSEGWKWAK